MGERFKLTVREDAAVWLSVAREQDRGRGVSSRWTYGYPYGGPWPRAWVRPDDAPDLGREPAEVTGEARARRVRSNRAILSKLLEPSDRKRSGRIVWARVSRLTGIPVRTFKAWWWGEERMTVERVAGIRLHIAAHGPSVTI